MILAVEHIGIERTKTDWFFERHIRQETGQDRAIRDKNPLAYAGSPGLTTSLLHGRFRQTRGGRLRGCIWRSIHIDQCRQRK